MPLVELCTGDALGEDSQAKPILPVRRVTGLSENHAYWRSEQAGHRAAVAAGLLHEPGGAESRHQSGAGANGEGSHEGVVLGVGVEQRQHHQVPVLRAQTHVLGDGLAQEDVVGVGDQNAFGAAGRAGSVQYGGFVQRVQRDLGQLVSPSFDESCV